MPDNIAETPPEITTNEVTPVETQQPIMTLNDILSKALDGKEFPDEPVQATTEKPQDKKSDKTPEKPVKETKEKPAEKSSEFKIPDEITKKIAGVEEKKTDDKVENPVIPDELPKEKSAQATAYKNMRELNKKLMTENSELKKNKPVANDEATKELTLLKAEYENLKKQNEEYDNELRLHKLESTPFYKNNIAKPLQTIRDTAAKLAKQYEVKAGDVMEAFQEPDIAKRNAMLSELTAGFNDYDKLTLLQQADKYSSKLEEEKVLRGQSKEALDFLTSKQKAEEAQKGEQFSKLHQQAADVTFKRLTENFGFMQKIEGNDEWNNEIDEINKTARAVDISKLSPQELAEMKYLALAFGRQNKVLQAYAKELHSHQEKLKSMRPATPDLNKGNAPTKQDTEDPNLSFIDAINRKLESQ